MDTQEESRLIEIIPKIKLELEKQIRKVFVGQNRVVEQLMIAIFSGSHCIFNGVPGLGKTLLSSSISKILNLEFRRIQFTPDIMPSDILGTEIIQEDPITHNRQYKFLKGPVFTQVLLADEINRATPKTQAALLECMQEKQVSVGNSTYQLSEPFLVFATQNPIEFEGTYPLPEAQLDRFLFQIDLDYPNLNEEKLMVQQTASHRHIDLCTVLTLEQLLNIQKHLIPKVPVADHVLEYAVKLVQNTRPRSSTSKIVKEYIDWGAGPRASKCIVLAAQTKSILDGRFTPSIDDIKAVAYAVLRHRIKISFQHQADGMSHRKIIESLF